MSVKKNLYQEKKARVSSVTLRRRVDAASSQRHAHKLEMRNEMLIRSLAEMQTVLRQYTDLYDFAPMGYFTISRNGIILQANLSGAQMLGVERKDLIERRFRALISVESLPAFDHFFESTFQTQAKGSCELALIKNERELIWVRLEATYSDTLNKQGGISHITAIDITEQKHAEDILQARLRITEFASGHSLSDLLQNALDELCALTSSPIGFFHFVEPDQCTLSLQAWSTRTLKEMCTAEGKGHHYNIDLAGVWVDCVREKRPIIHNDYESLPHRRGLPQGHAPVIREMVFPIMRNQKMAAIIGVGNKALDYTENDVAYASRLADLIWDITERKRAETQRETALEALRHSEARYRSILEDQTELICRYLPDGRLSFVNEAYARYYDQTAQQLINTNFLPHIPEPDLSLVIAKNSEITFQSPVVVYEHRIIKPDGKIRWQKWTHRGIYDAAGNLIEHQAVGRDITERKNAEEAVRESEERFRYVLENVRDAVWSSNLSGQFVFLSPLMERIYAIPIEEMVANPNFWIEVCHPDDLHIARASSETLMRESKAAVEYRILLRGGEARWIADRKFVIRNERGEPSRLIGVVSDITARKHAEEQIQFLAKFPAEDPNPVLRVARDGRLLYINEAGSRLLSQWDLEVGKAAPAVIQDAALQSMQSGKMSAFDLEHGERLYAFHVAPIVSAGYANLYGHDITESRQVKALQDAEARYRVLFEQSPYGVLLADLETGKTIEANETASKQLGYTRAEFTEKSIVDYEALEQGEHLREHLQRIIEQGGDDFETLHRTKQGEIRNVRVWVKILRLNERHLYYGILQDITERKRMEEANEKYSREITLLEERQRIASDLHDAVSQTLFSARLTAATLLRQPDRQSDSFSRSLVDLDRLVRSASGEIRLVLVELRNNALANVNLNNLLANLIDSGTARTNANLVFQCHVDDLELPPEIKIAFYRIAQEAMSNAIKHGKPANIQCILRENNQDLEMIVQDDGKGFMLDKAQDDHFGLQIMRERADLAGVELAIISQPGIGTSVTVYWKRE